VIRRRIVRRTIADDAVSALAESLHPVLRRVYGARGIRAAADLDLSLERLLPVSSLGGVEAAVDLLLACHRHGSKVLVIGDFDADGATSTALVVRQLRRLGFKEPGFLVPDRFKFGYGLTPEIVRVAADLRPSLIVTVDNGVASLEGVAEATRNGIPVLVTDHHLPGQALPEAAAIVNPNMPGERFRQGAAGVGVAFYVVATSRAHAPSGLIPWGRSIRRPARSSPRT
jgi:single-stranded-DNA-specific exonuclease